MIGSQIKEFRKKRGLTLNALGQSAGVTASYLSQVERNQAEPSITTLRKIAGVLKIPVYKLLVEEEDGENKIVTRKNERRSTQRMNRKASCEFITPMAKDNMDLSMVCFIVKIPPYAETGAMDDSLHNADEMILVNKGLLEVSVEDDVFVLNEGDSIYIKANLLHIIKNVGSSESEFISCISPAIY